MATHTAPDRVKTYSFVSKVIISGNSNSNSEGYLNGAVTGAANDRLELVGDGISPLSPLLVMHMNRALQDQSLRSMKKYQIPFRYLKSLNENNNEFIRLSFQVFV
jgi:hypothetical protein